MQITSIEAPPLNCSVWSGTAIEGTKKLLWYYEPRSWLHVQEQDERNPCCWMNIDPPDGAKRAALKVVRLARKG
jgi:hypothetical protein